MAYSLPLPRKYRQWKVKIRDRETVEPPHVTFLRRTEAWRLNLRSGEFMDPEPDPDEVPLDLLRFVREHWNDLQDAWDDMYPDNPIESDDEVE